MDRYEARKAMVEDLDKLGLLVKVVPHNHSVGTHDRCHATVEPVSYTHLEKTAGRCEDRAC